MSQPNDSTFPQFKRFPTEVRVMIWLQAYEDSKEEKSEEVCIINRPIPPTGGFPATKPDQPCVDLPFPMLMHACRDSRAAILSAQAGVRFRFDPDAGCNIHCRELDPDIDTVYLNHSNFDDAMKQADYFGGHEQVIRRVAIDACIIIGLDSRKITLQVMPKFPLLCEVKVVLKSESRGVKAQTAFPPPTTRFKLVEAVPSGANKQTREIDRWMVHLRQTAQAQQPIPALMALPQLVPPLQASFIPNPTHLPPNQVTGLEPKFRPYVFCVPVGRTCGMELWGLYPRAGSAKR